MFVSVHFTCTPPSHPQSMYVCLSEFPPLKKSSATLMMLILNKKFEGWKEGKGLIVCKLHIKDHCFLNSYIYNDNTNIYMFIKNVKWKENVYAFLIKNTFICWNMLKTKKQLPSNFSERTAWCLKITQFFSQSEHTDRLYLHPPLPLFVLVDFLRSPTPLPVRWMYFLNDPNYGCQEKYLLYSGVGNHSWATTKKTKVLFPYELFNIKTKTKTEIIFKFMLTLFKICRVEKREKKMILSS